MLAMGSSREELAVLGSAGKEGLLGRDQGECMILRRAPKLRLGVARARENGQEKEHCSYCLLTYALEQACHASSCTDRTSYLWTLPVGKAQYCTKPSLLSPTDTP